MIGIRFRSVVGLFEKPCLVIRFVTFFKQQNHEVLFGFVSKITKINVRPATRDFSGEPEFEVHPTNI